jgi:hypothetical protein
VPPMATAALIFGHRTLSELREAYPDVNVHGRWRLFVESLFPKRSAYIYTTY